jgi:hypothetical protein
MRLEKSTPRRGRTGCELLLALALPLFIVVAAVIALMPANLQPACRFYQATGIPCPACGCLRSLQHVLHGDLAAALRIQPLATLSVFAAAAYAAYSALVVLGVLPRLRLRGISTFHRTTFLLLLLAAVLANWLYLLLRA